MTATIDDIANTLGELEALAQSTGEWDGADPVEFSADGITWLPVWVPTSLVGEPGRFPAFARATVHRKGVAAPTVIVVAWAESVPADDEWRALWERKPMKLFGSFALRSAIRHAFRDVVGDLRGPDEDTTGPSVGAPPVDRNWGDEIDAAATIEELDAIWADAKTSRARTGGMEMAYKIRRGYLIDAEWEPGASGPVTLDRAAQTLRTAAQIAPVVDEAIAEAAADEEESAPGPSENAQGPATSERLAALAASVTRPTPQDHLPPANRAARRAAAKGKGRRK